MSKSHLAEPPPRQIRFGPGHRFELQPTERRLLADGRPVAVGRRALDLLIVLSGHPDRILTKDELLERVWPGLVVEEGNLQMQVSNLRKLIGAEMIATVPGRGYRFTAMVDAAPRPAARATDAPAPGQNRLIGRDVDLARIALHLRTDDVTLLGPPGVGKTSVARVTARRWAGRAVWVDLATLPAQATWGQVAGALARAIDLPLTGNEADVPRQLRAALGGPTLLLVLDNAEQAIEHCAALVSALRSGDDGPRLLVTSQVPLAIDGERIMRLEPLGWGRDDAPVGATPHGALALLIDRIAAADPRFVPTAATLPLLRAVCAQLDGLPLALELAAARVPLLGVRGVHDALAQRFAMLTRGEPHAAARHRPLHAALDWSHRLLTPAEQRLFRALGAFADGFTLDLAARVMTDAPEARWNVVDHLTALAGHSLIVVGDGDPPRYRLPETMRAFALERLARTKKPPDDAATVRRRHARAVLALFARAAGGDATSRAPCLAEMENARAAVAWARDHDLALAAELSARVTVVTTFSVWRAESGAWLLALEPLMDGPAARAVPAAVQALWWTERARVGAMNGEPVAAAAARRAVALWRPLAQPSESLRATLVWVRSIGTAGAELDDACAALQALVAAIPDLAPRERLDVVGARVHVAELRGDRPAVRAAREEEAALARQLGPEETDVLGPAPATEPGEPAEASDGAARPAEVTKRR